MPIVIIKYQTNDCGTEGASCIPHLPGPSNWSMYSL